MRDGIYRVDFRPGIADGKGIAIIRGGAIKGIDQTCVYVGELIQKQGRLSGRITFQEYLPTGQALTVSADTIKIVGTEEEGAFELDGQSASNPESQLKILGTWVAEL